MSPEKIALLIDVGFDWGTTRKDAWEEKFQMLRDYKEKHGDCNVPTRGGTKLEQRQLGRWVSRQRELYKFSQHRNSETNRNIFPQERFMRLNLLGFQWSAAQSSSNTKDEEEDT